MHKPTLLASLLLLLPSATLAADGAVHVRGQLLCNGKPYANQMIELLEKNWFGLDSLVIESETDDNGQFVMKASIHEWPLFYPEPYIFFGNYCDVTSQIGSMQCGDAIKIYVPKYFITDGHLPKSIFDIGSVEMMGVKSEKKGLEPLIYYIMTQQECHTVHTIR